jgi:hypothetical protein
LSADIISDITAFYTFLKASRDATGSMSLWKESYYNDNMRRNDIISVIYVCFLMTIHGKESLVALVEDKHRAKFAKDVFNSIEVRCYCFLLTVLQPLDQRYRLLSERREFYLNLVKPYAREDVGYGAALAEKVIAECGLDRAAPHPTRR